MHHWLLWLHLSFGRRLALMTAPHSEVLKHGDVSELAPCIGAHHVLKGLLLVVQDLLGEEG